MIMDVYPINYNQNGKSGQDILFKISLEEDDERMKKEQEENFGNESSTNTANIWSNNLVRKVRVRLKYLNFADFDKRQLCVGLTQPTANWIFVVLCFDGEIVQREEEAQGENLIRKFV